MWGDQLINVYVLFHPRIYYCITGRLEGIGNY
jgi:hypothetical protein